MREVWCVMGYYDNGHKVHEYVEAICDTQQQAAEEAKEILGRELDDCVPHCERPRLFLKKMKTTVRL